MSAVPSARLAAVRILTEVYDDRRSLTQASAEVLPQISDPRDRALTQDLCYGVLRFGPRLEALTGKLLNKPLAARDGDVQCLILVGLYQLLYTRVPAHAAVAATVAVTAALGKSWARGLVNAVLRRCQRESEELLARVDADDAASLAHPRWLLERFRRDWPQDWRRIAEAGNEHPPMWLRVNRLRGPREAYLQELQAAGFSAAAPAHTPDGLLLDKPTDVARLPGFAQGRFSVQDGAAQQAAALLDLHAGQRVLDLCAAPGGKTAHILERGIDLAALVAVDVDAARLARVQDTLNRLGLVAQLRCADAAHADEWWDGVAFDRVLLDAPCSGTGVIRRHPDIKRLRRAEDIAGLAARQRELLDAAWRVLAPGGMLLYATCSIIHDENNLQIQDFLARHDDARLRPHVASHALEWGRALPFGRQILPGEHDMDGFFYACIDKLALSLPAAQSAD
ncbi:MAG: 16S rRNA (cytosine(967)-C(5))-methyltransferase RsmB [Chromatiales bacterium]|jgi:16S rRNA (cytosine967-C5)-methyltransferase|nr:16S rRNA (cytosine(967)-C(5))-methyltransferase RsmB [Chromatiales bacterium]